MKPIRQVSPNEGIGLTKQITEAKATSMGGTVLLEVFSFHMVSLRCNRPNPTGFGLFFKAFWALGIL